MESQLDFLKEAVLLAEQNPSLEINFCPCSDEMMEYGWTAHQITKIKINPWFEDDERIMVDEDEILDHFRDGYWDNDNKLTDEQIEEQIAERYNKEVKNAICIYTNAG